jgi:hypothetical protein
VSGLDTKMAARIRALLAKAESTTFPPEAEALTAKAQELMARYRIERAELEADDPRDTPGRLRIRVDRPYSTPKESLLSAIAAANHCRAVIADGHVHVFGFDADLEVVELLFTSLLVQATAAMTAAGPQVDTRGRSRTRSFRHSFLVAYALRIGERLRETTRQAEAEHRDLLPVLVRRDEAVEAVRDAAFPRLRQARTVVSNRAGLAAGRLAADRASLGLGAALPR